jgi:hypothetical protein
MAPQHFAVTLDDKGEPRWVNRRGSVRYQCALATAGRVYPQHRQEFHRGWVMDLSRGGAGLLLNRSFPIGQEVVLQIGSPSTRERFEFPARVAHIIQHVSGEWWIGFEFLTPLTDDLLDTLL